MTQQPGGAGVRDEIKQEPKKEVPIKAEIPQVTVEAKPPVAGTVDQNTPSSGHEKPPRSKSASHTSVGTV